MRLNRFRDVGELRLTQCCIFASIAIWRFDSSWRHDRSPRLASSPLCSTQRNSSRVLFVRRFPGTGNSARRGLHGPPLCSPRLPSARLNSTQLIVRSFVSRFPRIGNSAGRGLHGPLLIST